MSTPRRPTNGGKIPLPFRVFALLLLAAAVVIGAWLLFPPSVRVDRPHVDFLPDRITATTHVKNNTGSARETTVRFVLAYADRGSKSRPSSFTVVDQKDVAARLEPHSSEQLSCDFRRPERIHSLTVDAQAISH